MKKRFCDICGEEIKADESFVNFRMECGDDVNQIDAHRECYQSLIDSIKRCVDGDRINS